MASFDERPMSKTSSHQESQVGTWFLSYLCELGVIDNEDEVWSNMVTGIVIKPLGEIPIGSEVFIKMIQPEEMIVHYRELPKEVDEDEDEDENEEDSVWWEQPDCLVKTIRISCIFSELK